VSSKAQSEMAIVTGAGGGIGRAIVERLLDTGWQVTGLDLGPGMHTRDRYEHIKVDLCDTQAIDRVIERLSSARAFVHAAGILRVGTLDRLDVADGERMWKLHVDAAVRIARVLVPKMCERADGRIVLLGSRVAQGMPGRSQYAASKAALVAMARSWAAEVAARGVTVNVVSPAATQTSMLDDPARASSAPRLPPLGRLIQPHEIAALVEFLLSPLAAAITGQDIAICGGASLPH